MCVFLLAPMEHVICVTSCPVCDLVQTYHVEETQQELSHNEVMFWKILHHLFTPADPQAALNI